MNDIQRYVLRVHAEHDENGPWRPRGCACMVPWIQVFWVQLVSMSVHHRETLPARPQATVRPRTIHVQPPAHGYGCGEMVHHVAMPSNAVPLDPFRRALEQPSFCGHDSCRACCQTTLLGVRLVGPLPYIAPRAIFLSRLLDVAAAARLLFFSYRLYIVRTLSSVLLLRSHPTACRPRSARRLRWL
jgi:hypothetical protein